MTPLFLSGLLDQFGFRLGLWVALLVAAWYIYKGLNIGSMFSEWLIRFAAVLVFIGLGLATNVITGLDLAQLWGIVLGGVGLVLDILRATGVSP